MRWLVLFAFVALAACDVPAPTSQVQPRPQGGSTQVSQQDAPERVNDFETVAFGI